MILYLPFLLAFAIGSLLFQWIKRPSLQINASLNAMLSMALGLGLCATLTYASLFVFGGFHRTGILGLHVGLLIILLIPNLKPFIQNLRSIKWTMSWLSPLAWLAWGLVAYVIHFMALTHPYGEWDAWALYNMKTKFMIAAGPQWQSIFNDLHWYTQPDYPLLLPSINVFHHAISGQDIPAVPMSTSIVLALMIGWLLFAAIREITGTIVAFAGSLVLMVNPFYIFQSTAQYADTLLGYYLLASIVCIHLTFLKHSKPMALISGLMLGYMTFSKNEGIVMSILLIIMFGLYTFTRRLPLVRKRQALSLIGCLLIGYLLTSSPTIILKLFIAPKNKDIFGGLSAVHMKFLNWDGFMLIVNAFKYELTHKRWAFIWGFLAFLFVAANRKIVYKECKIYLTFFVLYMTVLCFIYLTTVNFELSWRLKSTVHRICYYLLPSLLFFCYYALFRKKLDDRISS